MSNGVYHLMCNDTRLAVLEYYEMDHPWIYCHFVADPTFAAIQSLFEESNRLRNKRPYDWDTWFKAYEKIAALDLYVVDTYGRICKPTYIHIEDGIAWFRRTSACWKVRI